MPLGTAATMLENRDLFADAGLVRGAVAGRTKPCCSSHA